jgi:hypothetical protein
MTYGGNRPPRRYGAHIALTSKQKSNKLATMTEKRLFERFDINVPVRLALSQPQAKDDPIALEADNLSAGGIFFKTPKGLPHGTKVRMEIILQFDELKTEEDPLGSFVIQVTGYVQRSGADGTAICFNNDYDVSASLDFLDQQERQQA